MAAQENLKLPGRIVNKAYKPSPRVYIAVHGSPNPPDFQVLCFRHDKVLRHRRADNKIHEVGVGECLLKVESRFLQLRDGQEDYISRC